MSRHSTETVRPGMLRPFTELRGYTIGATDGDIGSIEDMYLDDVSWTVRYLVVDTGTWLSGRKVLLSPASLRSVEAAASRVHSELTRRQVQESPSIDTDKPVSRQQEEALQLHYGYEPYWAGPYRWGPGVYPYPLLDTGVLLPTEPVRRDAVAEELVASARQDRDEHLHSAAVVKGYGIRATDGELGHVEDFLIDDRDWAIRYLIVDPRNWWPGPHVLVGTDWIRDISWDDSTVDVDVTREAVRSAPRYEARTPFDREAEARLYAHHGRSGYWDRRPEAWRHYPPAA